jgi:maltose/moltooligosaccharide transporter
MEWLPMIGVGIAWAYLYCTCCGHCHLTKWAITWGFQLLYRNPSISCRIHFRVLVSKFLIRTFYALLIGGASMILAGIIALTINDETKLQ